MTKQILSQERLKQLLHYDPDTGAFTWVSPPKKHANKLGKKAGNISDQGYVRIGVDGNEYKAHRLAWLYMTGSFPENEIDHINHNRSDNAFANLRASTRIENARNIKLSSNNKSGVCGVCWNAVNQNWRTTITINGKQINGGSHNDYFEAVCARKSLERKLQFHENHGAS